MSDDLEDLWAEILSAEPDRIRSALAHLSADERRSVVAHLRRMAGETGWSEGQQHRARTALAALECDSSVDA